MSNGFELFDAAGALINQDDETLTRVVTGIRVAAQFSGTISVPSFDSNRGMFYVSYHALKYDILTAPHLFDDDDSWVTTGAMFARAASACFLPSLSWNNTTRLMTCAPASLPAGFVMLFDGDLPDYRITFLHFI